MTHPSHFAASNPGKPAYIMAATGEAVTYGELEASSNRFAHLFRALGVGPGGHVALLLENRPGFFEICWGAQRAGLLYTPISPRLQPQEIARIVGDSGAGVLIVSGTLAEQAAALVGLLPASVRRLSIGGALPGYESCEARLAGLPATPVADQQAGAAMIYSSGTTGRPKGIKRSIAGGAYDAPEPGFVMFKGLYKFGEDTVYLSPAPLYHAAPLIYSMGTMRCGGTVVVMEQFDAREALALMERHRVTHSQWVPTMFVRMLKLDPAERRARDLSSHRVAIHASAPCPVAVKRAMMEWWGPILHEFYAGTEGNGICSIGPQEWLDHPGSVGRAMIGELRIVRDDGRLADPGETGTVYFAKGVPFVYHNDPERTREAHNDAGWSTLGDVGHVDKDGYLYLTDRKSDLIIVGGVNVYPQEAENVLIGHPAVIDVAVVGIPHAEYGEEVKAVVQPADMALAGPALEQELIACCRAAIADYKCPRSIDFSPQLPRDPAGKLYRRVLRERYGGGAGTRSAG
jgi:long-chain acyl-CoA synthetase